MGKALGLASGRGWEIMKPDTHDRKPWVSDHKDSSFFKDRHPEIRFLAGVARDPGWGDLLVRHHLYPIILSEMIIARHEGTAHKSVPHRFCVIKKYPG